VRPASVFSDQPAFISLLSLQHTKSAQMPSIHSPAGKTLLTGVAENGVAGLKGKGHFHEHGQEATRL
jgi:hypothetical protein